MSLRDRMRRAARRIGEIVISVAGEEDSPPQAAPEAALPPIEQLVRINGEYCRAVEQFVRQRDEDWKKMFEDDWRAHLNAQRLLEKQLRMARAALGRAVDLWHGRSMPLTIDSPPVGLASAYEKAVTEAVNGAPQSTDAVSLRDTLMRSVPMDDAAAVCGANEALFALIRQVEEERDTWRGLYGFESRLHLQHQAALEGALTGAAESFGALLKKLNERRKQQDLPPIDGRSLFVQTEPGA